MIIAPRSRATRKLASVTTPLAGALGGVYAPLLVAGVIRRGGGVNYADPEAVIAALSDPDTFLAAWTHYIAFDLFVGRWIWSDAQETGIDSRVPLILTWMFGPAGLAAYLARRRLNAPGK
jgi:hypothetical protein